MNQSIVVTNLRMPEADYHQIKILAAESSMSVNAYITKTLKDATRQNMLQPTAIHKKTKRTSQKKSLFEELVAIAKMPNKPMGASEDDKIIYDL